MAGQAPRVGRSSFGEERRQLGVPKAQMTPAAAGWRGFSRMRLTAVAHEAIDPVPGWADRPFAGEQGEQRACSQAGPQRRECHHARCGLSNSSDQVSLPCKTVALIGWEVLGAYDVSGDASAAP